MDPSRIKKCLPDDPNRCQEVTGIGQCQNLANEDTDRCEIHMRHGNVMERRKLHNYRLERWQARVDDFVDSDEIKSVAGEIGILRMTLEQILNRIETPNQFIIHSNVINDTVTRIEKLVSSFDRLENRAGKLLDKSALIQLAGNIVDVISKHVPANIAEIIANEIFNEILMKQCQTDDSQLS